MNSRMRKPPLVLVPREEPVDVDARPSRVASGSLPSIGVRAEQLARALVDRQRESVPELLHEDVVLEFAPRPPYRTEQLVRGQQPVSYTLTQFDELDAPAAAVGWIGATGERRPVIAIFKDGELHRLLELSGARRIERVLVLDRDQAKDKIRSIALGARMSR